jgi:HEAT repeat protein
MHAAGGIDALTTAMSATDDRLAGDAAWALGEMHAAGGIDALTTAMSATDDRLAGDAAWALGEIIVASPKDGHTAALVDRWLHLGKHGHFAGAIDGTAALARVLWALPREARAPLLAQTRAQLNTLAFHKSRLVRVNAIHALAAIGDDDAIKILSQLVHDAPSLHVKVAAAIGLSRANNPRANQALKAALDKDSEGMLREAVKAVPNAIPARSDWRTYYVVDPGAGDAPVRQEPYFVVGGDGLAWASYTDARGELTTEHAPAGEATVWPASREGEY